VESTLLARDGSPLFRTAWERGWRVEALGLGRAMSLARQHDLVHAHDGHGHTAGAIVSPEQAGGFAPGGVSGAVASEIRARAALSGGIGIRQGVLMKGGVPEEKISVVYDGVPLLEPSPARS
jgi:hypothetical protein